MALSKSEKQQIKREVYLMGLITLRTDLEQALQIDGEDTPEDRDMAEDLIFCINVIIKEDFPDFLDNTEDPISKPNWNELKKH